MGVAYRFAEAWNKVNNGAGNVEEVLPEVEREMEKDFERVEGNGEKVVEEGMRRIMFDNRALEGDDLEGDFVAWTGRLERTPYWKWTSGARHSLNKFIAIHLLDFDVYQYNDMLLRRGGVANFDDRRLEDLVERTRVGIWGEELGNAGKRKERDSGMSNAEVGEVVMRFRGIAEVAGGWEGMEEAERAEFREFTKRRLFGGLVPKIKGVREEDVVMTAIRDVLNLEHVEVERIKGDEEGVVEEEEEEPYQPTVSDMIDDQSAEGYSVFHKANMLTESEVREAMEGEEGFPEKGTVEIHAEQQRVRIANDERGRVIEGKCTMWENGVWEECGKVRREGMEGIDEEERARAWMKVEVEDIGDTFDRFKLGHTEVEEGYDEGFMGKDYVTDDFEELLEESGDEIEDPVVREGGGERIDWFEPRDIHEGWRVEWRIAKELREKGLEWREVLRGLDEEKKGEVNEGKLKEKLKELGVEVENEEIFNLKVWMEKEE